jgi:hypothetical protein
MPFYCSRAHTYLHARWHSSYEIYNESQNVSSFFYSSHWPARIPLNKFIWKLILVDFTKILQDISALIKNIHFIWRPTRIYVNIPTWLVFVIDIVLFEVQITFEEEFYDMSIKNQLTTQLVLTKTAVLNQRTYRIQSNTYPPPPRPFPNAGGKRFIFWNAVFLWNTKRWSSTASKQFYLHCNRLETKLKELFYSVFLYFLKNAAFYEFPGFAHMPMGIE